MRLLILGAGGVGSAVAKIAARRPFLEHVLLADYDLTRAQRAARPSATRGWRQRGWTPRTPPRSPGC